MASFILVFIHKKNAWKTNRCLVLADCCYASVFSLEISLVTCQHNNIILHPDTQRFTRKGKNDNTYRLVKI